MVEFIPAEKLKSKFDVFGHFYSVQVAPKKVVECRSVLEIVETAHAPEMTAVLSSRKPDAVFIMMNPGSSRPLIVVDNRIHSRAIHELPISLVPTKASGTVKTLPSALRTVFGVGPGEKVTIFSVMGCSRTSAELSDWASAWRPWRREP